MVAAEHGPRVVVQKVTKRFPGVRALDQVDLQLNAGEVLAVIGENGAGKSTLMRVLAGIEQPDSGRVSIDGREAYLATPAAAMQAGIALIHQELNLCDNLSVAENVFLGREPQRLGWLDRRAMRRQTQDVLARLGLDVDPATRVDQLSLGQQQMVEIARALSSDARIAIMDEPTSSLSLREAEVLFHVIDQLRDRGVGIIYISHRLGEVRRLADRALVLRDGRTVGELAGTLITHDNMVRLMVGRDVAPRQGRKPLKDTSPRLVVRALATAAHPRHGVDLQVAAGEIVGIAGLVGAGRSELLQTIFGITQPVRGRLELDGTRLQLRRPLDAIRSGIAMVPEDRKLQGMILEMTVRENLSLATLRRDAVGRLLINRALEKNVTRAAIDRLQIRPPAAEQIAQYLSGGNQQKLVLGKWLAMQPRVLLLDEPTRGVDVGAKQEIYALIEQLAQRRVAVLFASSEMEELISLADRVLVMHDGVIAGDLTGDEIAEEAIMRLATGGRDLRERS